MQTPEKIRNLVLTALTAIPVAQFILGTRVAAQEQGTGTCDVAALDMDPNNLRVGTVSLNSETQTATYIDTYGNTTEIRGVAEVIGVDIGAGVVITKDGDGNLNFYEMFGDSPTEPKTTHHNKPGHFSILEAYITANHRVVLHVYDTISRVEILGRDGGHIDSIDRAHIAGETSDGDPVVAVYDPYGVFLGYKKFDISQAWVDVSEDELAPKVAPSGVETATTPIYQLTPNQTVRAYSVGGGVYITETNGTLTFTKIDSPELTALNSALPCQARN